MGTTLRKFRISIFLRPNTYLCHGAIETIVIEESFTTLTPTLAILNKANILIERGFTVYPSITPACQSGSNPIYKTKLDDERLASDSSDPLPICKYIPGNRIVRIEFSEVKSESINQEISVNLARKPFVRRPKQLGKPNLFEMVLKALEFNATGARFEPGSDIDRDYILSRFYRSDYRTVDVYINLMIRAGFIARHVSSSWMYKKMMPIDITKSYGYFVKCAEERLKSKR